MRFTEYPIEKFENVIQKVLQDNTIESIPEKSRIARKEAFDRAGRWTDGTFKVPTVEEFQVEIEKRIQGK